MQVCDYTFEEIRSLLQRSDLTTLVTEGRDDYSLFRGIRNRVGTGDLLPAGGKQSVLLLRNESHTFSCPKISFLVDRDTWLFSGVPNGVAGDDLIITDGYSIENDMLRDINPEALLDEDQIEYYKNDLTIVIRWYCSGVKARLSGATFDFDKPISFIIDPFGGFTPEAQIDMALWPAEEELIEQVSADYKRLLRGKTWLKLLSRYLCANDRPIQHSPKSLLEIGMRSNGENSTRLISAIRYTLT